MAQVNLSGNQNIDGLLWGYRWDPTNLTYSFPTGTAEYGGYTSVSGFEAFNPAQQAAAVRAIGQINAFSGLNITVATVAHLRFAEANSINTGNGTRSVTTALGTPPDPEQYPSFSWGDMWFNHTDYNNPIFPGTFAATLGVMHELGHSLGLKHGHDSQLGHGVTFPELPADHDSFEYSVMTYSQYPGDPNEVDTAQYHPTTYMQNDIAALQWMYGADYTAAGANPGDSRYTWHQNTGKMSINGLEASEQTANYILMTIWDGGGRDTYDLSNYSRANVFIDLRPGEWSTFTSNQLANLGDGHLARGNVANALLYANDTRSLIEDAIGGKGSDTLIGNAANNFLAGGEAYGRLADVNGDNRADLVEIGVSGGVKSFLSTGAALNAPISQSSLGMRNSDKFGDFNGDNRDDVIQLYEGGGAYVWTSNGSGFNGYGFWGSGVRPKDKIGDFNGDGRDDVIQLYETGTAFVWTSTGTSFNPYRVWGIGVRPQDKIGDFNGDGRDDVIQLYESGTAFVWLSNGTSFNAARVWGTGVRPTDKVGDFNGDGKDDIIQLYENGNAYVWLANSAGTGFNNYTVWTTGQFAVRPTDKIGDFNGDGKDDIIQLHENGNAYVWLANAAGTAFLAPTVWFLSDERGSVSPTNQIGDFNADGRDDLIQQAESNAFVWISNSSTGRFNSPVIWNTGVQGLGADKFWFPTNFGLDTVGDFQVDSGDVLQFDRTYFSSFADVMAHTVDDNLGNTTIIYDANNQVRLLNVLRTDFTANDFLFI
jgi:serralysin